MSVRTILVRIAILFAVVLPHLSLPIKAGFAQELLPDIKPYPASGLNILIGTDNRKHLRFTTLSWNSGAGPVEIVAGKADKKARKQKVYQRIYSVNGSHRDALAGSFTWHQAHNHFHFDGYALYTLLLAGAPATSQRTGEKNTTCIMDTTRINSNQSAIYTTCGSRIQGMTVGWGDEYGYQLAGQSFDITGLPDGDYELRIEIDPHRRIIEANDTNNISSIVVHIQGATVTTRN
jgi:hypothetical protein